MINHIISKNRGSVNFFGKKPLKIKFEQVGEKFKALFLGAIIADAPLKRTLNDNILRLKNPARTKLYAELSKDRYVKIAELNKFLKVDLLQKVNLETALVGQKEGALEFMKNLSSEMIVLDGLTDGQKIASANKCADADPATTLRTLKFFYLDEAGKKMIVLKCANKIPNNIIDELKGLDLSEEMLSQAYKVVAGLNGLEIINKISDIKVSDKKVLNEIIEIAIKNILPDEDAPLTQENGYTAFLLTEKIAPLIEEVFDPAKFIEYVSKFDGKFALHMMNKYGNKIPDGSTLKDIAEDILVKYPDVRDEKNIIIMNNQVIKKIRNIDERKDIVKTVARNCGGLASKFFNEYDLNGISLEDKIEILLDAYNNDPVGTMGFVANYNLIDLRGLCINGDNDKNGENKVSPEDIKKVLEIFAKAGKHIPHDISLDQKF